MKCSKPTVLFIINYKSYRPTERLKKRFKAKYTNRKQKMKIGKTEFRNT